MPYRTADYEDRMLKRLDERRGQAGAYRIPLSTEMDENGDIVTTYSDPVPVVLRSAGTTVVELAGFANAGLGQVDKVWWMRSAYASEVKADYIFETGTKRYQVIERGASLDEMGLLWTIATRERQ